MEIRLIDVPRKDIDDDFIKLVIEYTQKLFDKLWDDVSLYINDVKVMEVYMEMCPSDGHVTPWNWYDNDWFLKMGLTSPLQW